MTDLLKETLAIECLQLKTESLRNIYGQFRIGPVKKGQGLTLGNALRRVLLENIETVSITAIKIPNITHEFSVIPGIQESVLEVLLNLKKIILKGKLEGLQKASLKIQGPGILTAKNIKLPLGIQIVDSDQYIATVSSEMQINFELFLEVGCGYFESEILYPKSDINFLTLSVDPVFMPINKVNYKIQSESTNENKNLEYIYIEIWTNGSIQPNSALKKAADVLMNLIQPISKVDHSFNDGTFSQSEFELTEISIDHLKLSARAYNCLVNAKIYTLSTLLKYTKQDLLEIKNFGENSAEEVIQSVDLFLKKNNIKI